MLKDKRVVYGLIGGAAVLIGAAVLSHYMGGEDSGNKIDDDIAQLGPLQKDGQGHIDFD